MKLKHLLIIITALIFTISGINLLVKKYPDQLISIRERLFTKSYEHDIYKSPSASNSLSIYDSPERIKQYKQKFLIRLPGEQILSLPKEFKISDKELLNVLRIACITDTINDGINAGGGTYKNLEELKDHLLNPSRGGRCSDYSEFFIAQSTFLDFKSREIKNKLHTTNEVYLPKLKKWIWIDSQFDLIATDSMGNVMNAYEIAHSTKIKLIPFNKKLQKHYLHFLNLYSKDAFSELIYSIDSRILYFDSFRELFPKRIYHSIFTTFFLEKRRLFLKLNNVNEN
jgi:hypothetical protein